MNSRFCTVMFLCCLGLPLVWGGEKLLLDFEKEECFSLAGWKKAKGENDAVIRFNTYGSYHYIRRGDATRGAWALVKEFKKPFAPLRKGISESALVAVKRRGRFFNGFGWMRKKGLAGDWSAYRFLCMDVKAAGAAVTLRVEVADTRTVPVPLRRYRVLPGKWNTLVFDLQKAADPDRPGKVKAGEGKALFYRCRGSALYRARVLDLKDVFAVFVNVEEAEGPAAVLMDNMRLVSSLDRGKEGSGGFLDDRSPWPEAELLPASTRPRRRERNGTPARKGGGSRWGRPVVIDLSGFRRTSYGRMHNDRAGIAVGDGLHMALTVNAGMNRFVLVTADGGKTWRKMGEGLWRGNLMMVGACCTPAADGSDLLVVTLKHCAGGETTSWVWFKRVVFTGQEWRAEPSVVMDVDSWHCPEHKMDVLRTPAGRIWAAWAPTSRSGGVVVRYSDDVAKTWRDLGRGGHLAGKGRPLLVPYGKDVACFFSRGWQDYLYWAWSDGERWVPARAVLKGLRAKPVSGTGILPDVIWLAARSGKRNILLRMAGGAWKREEAVPGEPLRLCALPGGGIACVGIEGAKIVLGTWRHGKWSRRVLAEEKERIKDIAVPTRVRGDSLPVAWTSAGGKWIKFLKAPITAAASLPVRRTQTGGRGETEDE